MAKGGRGTDGDRFKGEKRDGCRGQGERRARGKGVMVQWGRRR